MSDVFTFMNEYDSYPFPAPFDKTSSEPPDKTDIWELTDVRPFITKMNLRIFIKAGTDSAKQNITEPEKMFYVCSEILNWISRCGIRFVMMPSVCEWTEAVRRKAFCAIGADKMADYCERLIKTFFDLSPDTAGEILFMSPEEYEHFLAQGEANEAAGCINRLNNEFPALEAETEALLYRYAHENKDSFDC